MTLDPKLQIAKSFPLFVAAASRYLGFTVPQLHIDMAKAYQSGFEYVSISAFRNSAKSYLAELYVCWRLYLNPTLWVLVVSGESSRADQFAQSVGGTMQQLPWLQHIAPSRVSKSFTVSGIQTGDWPSLTSRTSRGNLRGPRADLIILDDPIGTRDKDSPAVREKVNNSLHEIPLILNPAGRQYTQRDLPVPSFAKTRCICLNTPTGSQPNDFYQGGKGSFFDRFKRFKFPAVIEPVYDNNGLLTAGKSAWAERWPMDKLIEEQNRNPYVFRVERQVDNSIVEDAKSLIRFGNIPVETLEIDQDRLHCWADPSGGGDEYAYAIGALVPADHERGARIYVHSLGGWAGLSSDEAGRELLDMLQELGVYRLNVEDNYPAAAGLKRMAKDRNQSLIITPFKSSKNKETRLKKTLPVILNSGHVVFSDQVLSEVETVRQLRGLRATPGLPEQDDRLDCLEWLCSEYQAKVTATQRPKDHRTGRVRFA